MMIFIIYSWEERGHQTKHNPKENKINKYRRVSRMKFELLKVIVD